MGSNTSTYISDDLQDGIGQIQLNRPPLNVLHIPMIAELESALERLAGLDSVRALVLSASGKSFSAGVDVADHTPDKVDEMIPLFDRVCVLLAEFPVPTIAAVEGHALGGGCELVQCCDLAVMAESAKIGQPEIQLASLAPIAALRLPALVGFRQAADLLFTGRALSAQEALEMGLVNAVVPKEQVRAWAMEKAAQMNGLSRAALILAKRALGLGFGDWTRTLSYVERLYLK